MKSVAGYILLLGKAYIVSSLIYLIEYIAKIEIGISQLIPVDAGMAFYFMTVGVLYDYAYFRSREGVSKASLFIALIMSIAIMLVQTVNFVISSTELLLSSARVEAIYNIIRIETILGLLSLLLLLKLRKTIYE